MDITKIDKNFIVETKIDQPDLKFYNALEKPFKIYGVFYEDGKFRRMPEAVAKSVSFGVLGQHSSTAGGRIRFRTDSPYVVVNAKMPPINKMPHFALTGHCGFDMYITEHGEKRYFRSFIPPIDIDGGFESIIWLPEAVLTRDIEINFPLYTDVNELYIGVKEGSIIAEHKPYKYEKPIVFYGSSITHGASASNPGNTYENFISHKYNYDYVNLGFAGSACAEATMAEYIAGLDMSLFVYDYDHNAKDAALLERTHYPFYMAVREKNPDLPIIMISRPDFFLDEEASAARRAVILSSYSKAREAGDNLVWFIDGEHLFDGEFYYSCTVDGVHPNDLGLFRMADKIGTLIHEILNK